MFDMNKFIKIANVVRKELSELGYSEIESNKYSLDFDRRSVNRLGCCSKINENSFNIKLNEKYAKYATDRELAGIIMHEFIHSLNNCMNHGADFKLAAQNINSSLGYDITTTKKDINQNYKQMLIDTSVYKYSITCKNCNKINHRQRKSKIINNPQDYKCKCGGSLIVQVL